jgi:DNA-binding transcriptional LysR family regulator
MNAGGSAVMELRHLRYFVAVAEELSFTRAAKRLGIKQPPLSLQIRQLEKNIGAPLFRRLTRSVELTDAGKLLLEEATIILKQVQQASIGVRRRARGETGKINIGSSGGTYFHPLIPAIIRDYRLQYPDVRIAPEASHTTLLIARLRAGQIDIAFIRPPIADDDGLAIDEIVDEDAVIIVPSGHALAEARSAPLSAFADDVFVLFPRSLNPTNYDSVIASCHAAGFSPKLGQEAPQIVSAIPMVAAGLGVSIVPRSISRFCTDGVARLAIKGNAPRAKIAVASRRDERSSAVRNFVTVARRIALAPARAKAGTKTLEKAGT